MGKSPRRAFLQDDSAGEGGPKHGLTLPADLSIGWHASTTMTQTEHDCLDAARYRL